MAITTTDWEKFQARRQKASKVIAAMVQVCVRCKAKSSQRKLNLDHDCVCSKCRQEEKVENEIYEGKGYGDFA